MLSLELLLSDREYEAVDYLRVKAALLQEHDIDVSQPGLPPQNAPKCIQTVSGLANSLLSKKPTSARLTAPSARILHPVSTRTSRRVLDGAETVLSL